MLPVYSAQQFRDWDRFTMEHKHMSSLKLMETAATAFVDCFTRHFDTGRTVLIFCGNGNNGGDGLAIARLLIQRSYQVMVVQIPVNDAGSPDYVENLNRLINLPFGDWLDSSKAMQFLNSDNKAVVVDAMIGSGLNRPLPQPIAKLVEALNALSNARIAVDIPTGLFVDQLAEGPVLNASMTISFQAPKRSFLMPESGPLAGQLELVDIGLSGEFILQTPTKEGYLQEEDIRVRLKSRNKFSYKNNFGHLAVIGGSSGMAGALCMAAKSALRSGCGLCSVVSPESGRVILQTAVPEAIYADIGNADWASYDTLAVGPGMGTSEEARQKVRQLLDSGIQRSVWDADALNILASENGIGRIPKGAILTPHIGEFDRLFGKSENHFKRIEKASEMSAKHEVYIILKGAHTAIISCEGFIYYNPTGNPGLAKAGSGDVLCGMVASFLAQAYSPLDASILGVYLHGLAADLAIRHIAPESLLPTDVIDHISSAINQIRA
ncbi:MAG TPA: NAD(P)H-hydrate dehydratase [Saprospiraceae bacterium]|nr:NAD(P)H-hydrate dehydratase [Saprospiraceae bacterium]